MHRNQSSRSTTQRAFTLLEILVVIAIILVIAAIAFPVFTSVKARSNQVVALNSIRQLTAAALIFASENDQSFPAEDAAGHDTWQAAADPANEKVWYNALPRKMGHKGVGDYATAPRDFYTADNVLYLPGAQYPDSDKKLVEPCFAIAINSKLQRRDKPKDAPKGSGTKNLVRLTQIVNPVRTVFFQEQGLKSESKTLAIQSKYDGAAKGSAKTFVGRYGGKGVLSFVDGHSELVFPKDLLTETGQIRFPQNDYVWTRSPDEDPN